MRTRRQPPQSARPRSKTMEQDSLAPLPVHGSPRTEPRKLGADLRTIAPTPENARRPLMDGGLFYCRSDNNHSIGGSCPLECRDHRGTTTPWRQDRDRTELNHRATTKCSRLSIQALDIVA